MPTVELTTNLLAEIGGWPALKEARVMVERGRVHDAHREGNVVRARIQGAEKTNDAQIILADRVANVEVRCTCAESRRTGRVCAHALAAGLAVLQPPKGSASAGSRRPPGDGAALPSPSSGGRRLPRVLIEDAPPGTPSLELTILLPLNLADALAKDPIRIILETNSQPLDTVLAKINGTIAVTEADDRVLTALEQLTAPPPASTPSRAPKSEPSSTPSAITRKSGSAKSNASKSPPPRSGPKFFSAPPRTVRSHFRWAIS